jgi:tetratricopeptide (TPR) repeat protein
MLGASLNCMQAPGSRVVRVFISSTFRDFQEERRLLVNEVFPELRRRARERFVDVIEVDLRWGITQDESERGETLPICLREIERSRPYFIGMLGERYGWVPERGVFSSAVLEAHPWLAPHAGSASMTEIEMLHGVLNQPDMASRALFYLRDPLWALGQPELLVDASAEARDRMSRLRGRIAQDLPENVWVYAEPQALASKVLADLWRRIVADFPAEQTPDAWDRERILHEAAMYRHLRFRVGGSESLGAIEQTLRQASEGAQGVDRHRLTLIRGDSGAGLSATLAVWTAVHRHSFPTDHMLVHSVGVSSESVLPDHLKARIIEWIRRLTGRTEAPNENSAATVRHEPGIAEWLGALSSHATQVGLRAVIVVDGLERLRASQHLDWLPSYIPPGVHVVVSASGKEAIEAVSSRDRFEVPIAPFEMKVRREFIEAYLGNYDRRLDGPWVDQIAAHPMAGNPGFLRKLLDELRLGAEHQELQQALDRLLAARDLASLQSLRLLRLETLCGVEHVGTVLSALSVSEDGLAEPELLSFAGVPPRTLAILRIQLEDALVEHQEGILIVDQSLRAAIEVRYLAAMSSLEMHLRLEKFWEGQPLTRRSARALVFHALQAQDWQFLHRILFQDAWARLAVCCVDDERMARVFRSLRQEANFDVLAWVRDGPPANAKFDGGPSSKFLEFLDQIFLQLRVASCHGPEIDIVVRHMEGAAIEESERAQVRIRESQLMWIRGDFARAAEAAQCAIGLLRRAGAAEGAIASAVLALADAWMAAGKPAEALTAIENYLSHNVSAGEISKSLGTRRIIRLITSRGDAAVDLGQFQEAFAHYMDAWSHLENAGYRAHLEERDNLYHSLSILYKRVGDFRKAQKLAVFAASSRMERLGREHLAVAAALHTAAGAAIGIGSSCEARALVKEALRVVNKLLDSEHAVTREVRSLSRAISALPWIVRCAIGAYPLGLALLTLMAKSFLNWSWAIGLLALGLLGARPLGRKLRDWLLRIGVQMAAGRKVGRVPIAWNYRLPELPNGVAQ